MPPPYKRIVETWDAKRSFAALLSTVWVPGLREGCSFRETDNMAEKPTAAAGVVPLWRVRKFGIVFLVKDYYTIGKYQIRRNLP